MTATTDTGKPSKRAVAYARTAREDGDGGIERQLDACHRLADQFGLQLGAELADPGVSGLERERPGLMQLLALVEAGSVDCVICTDFTRLSRDHQYCDQLCQRIERSGILLVTTSTGIYDDQAKAAASDCIQQYFKYFQDLMGSSPWPGISQ